MRPIATKKEPLSTAPRAAGRDERRGDGHPEQVLVVRLRARMVAHPRAALLDPAAVEEDAVAVDPGEPDLLEVEHGELEHVPVVVDDLQAVLGLAERQRDPVVVRQPAQLRAQRLLLARLRDQEEVVVGPVVGRVIPIGHRADGDEAYDARVGGGQLGQLGGEGGVCGCVHRAKPKSLFR